MSYTFRVRAATRVAVLEKVAAQLVSVAEHSPIHVTDHALALATATAYVGLLPDPDPDEECCVTMVGSVSGQWTDDATIKRLITASVNVSVAMVKAYYAPKKP